MQPQENQALEIAALGAQGDGVAGTGAGVRYVAFALPGERVVPEGEGLPRLLSAPSPDRARPICRHFGACGGCAAQHMGARLYAEWKHGIVATALRRRGLEPPVAPLRLVAPGARRRAVLTARRVGGRVVLGYHRRRSAELVDIAECPVLVGAIAARLPALRAVAALLPAPEVRLTVLATPTGLDVTAETARHPASRGRHGAAARAGPGPQARARGADPGSGAIAAGLGRIAVAEGLARVTVDGETLIERAQPLLSMGGVDVAVPPAAFVQAVEASEAIMRDLVVDALWGALRGTPGGDRASPRLVADLFCGVGTFTFALARRARVLALDRDAAAVAALAGAARGAQGLKPIETNVRDLFREPLSARELAPFDAVVLDPPRAGADAQVRELARSTVETVVAVSCDPGTLARDAQALVDGGYAIAGVTPIDQFALSAHVEAVAVLRRAAPGRRGAARRRPVR